MVNRIFALNVRRVQNSAEKMAIDAFFVVILSHLIYLLEMLVDSDEESLPAIL